jgi:hypothetical protein
MKLKEASKVIAKKLYHGEAFPLDLDAINMMMRHRKKLNSLDIYVTDIKENNYVGGLLVDLSAAWVLPLVKPHKRIQSSSMKHQHYKLQQAILMAHNRIPLRMATIQTIECGWTKLLQELKFDRETET